MKERDVEDLLRSARLEPAPAHLRPPVQAGEEEEGPALRGPELREKGWDRNRLVPLAAAAGVLVGVAVLIALAIRGTPPEGPPIGPARAGSAIWTFEEDRTGGPPAGFDFTACRKAHPGRWVVRERGGGKVVAQADGRQGERFASAVVTGTSYRDLKLSARLRSLSGYQRAGIVWRYQDADNYYCAAANPTYPGVRLDRVVDGRRIIIAQRHAPLRTGTWHTLTVEHRGHTIEVFADGVRLLKVRDETFPSGGEIGFWIKDDTVAEFDDLTVEELR